MCIWRAGKCTAEMCNFGKEFQYQLQADQINNLDSSPLPVLYTNLFSSVVFWIPTGCLPSFCFLLFLQALTLASKIMSNAFYSTFSHIQVRWRSDRWPWVIDEKIPVGFVASKVMRTWGKADTGGPGTNNSHKHSFQSVNT